MNSYTKNDIEKVALVDSEEEPKKGIIAKLIWVIAALILAGGGFVVWKFVLSPPLDDAALAEIGGETANAPPHKPPPFGEVYKIENIILNPASGRRHFMVSIGLEVFDKSKLEEIKRREPLLRDNLISMFSAQPVDVLSDVRYRQAFRSRVKKIMDYQLGAGVVTRVFFERWVFQ